MHAIPVCEGLAVVFKVCKICLLIDFIKFLRQSLQRLGMVDYKEPLEVLLLFSICYKLCVRVCVRAHMEVPVEVRKEYSIL